MAVYHTMLRKGNPFVRDTLRRLTGEKIDSKDQEGSTLLTIAAENQDIATVDLLLGKEANPNLSDAQQNTALHYAMKSGDDKLALLLLEHGADWQLLNAEGESSVHLAAQQSPRVCKRLLTLLFEDNPDDARQALHVPSQNGKTAYTIAKEHDDKQLNRYLASYALEAAVPQEIKPVATANEDVAQAVAPELTETLTHSESTTTAKPASSSATSVTAKPVSSSAASIIAPVTTPVAVTSEDAPSAAGEKIPASSSTEPVSTVEPVPAAHKETKRVGFVLPEKDRSSVAAAKQREKVISRVDDVSASGKPIIVVPPQRIPYSSDMMKTLLKVATHAYQQTQVLSPQKIESTIQVPYWKKNLIPVLTPPESTKARTFILPLCFEAQGNWGALWVHHGDNKIDIQYINPLGQPLMDWFSSFLTSINSALCCKVIFTEPQTSVAYSGTCVVTYIKQLLMGPVKGADTSSLVTTDWSLIYSEHEAQWRKESARERQAHPRIRGSATQAYSMRHRNRKQPPNSIRRAKSLGRASLSKKGLRTFKQHSQKQGGNTLGYSGALFEKFHGTLGSNELNTGHVPQLTSEGLMKSLNPYKDSSYLLLALKKLLEDDSFAIACHRLRKVLQDNRFLLPELTKLNLPAHAPITDFMALLLHPSLLIDKEYLGKVDKKRLKKSIDEMSLEKRHKSRLKDLVGRTHSREFASKAHLDRFLENTGLQGAHKATMKEIVESECFRRKLTSGSSCFETLNQIINALEHIKETAGALTPADGAIIEAAAAVQGEYRAYRDLLIVDSPVDRRARLVPPTTVVGENLGYYKLIDLHAQAVLALDENGRVKREKNQPGMHPVRHHEGIHFKFEPTAPGIEWVVDSVNKQLVGEGSPPTLLLKITRGNHVNHVLASKTVPGELLQTVLREHPDWLTTLSLNNFSGLCLTSWLVNHQDAKADNFIAHIRYSSERERTRRQTMRLVNIDNDVALGPPIKRQGDHQVINNKNILYCFPQMNSPVDKRFREDFLRCSPIQRILSILTDLQHKDAAYQGVEGLLDKIASERLGLPLQLPRFFFQPDHPCGWYTQLKRAYQHLKKHPYSTHWGLFDVLQPLVSCYYKALLEGQEDMPLEVMEQVYGIGEGHETKARISYWLQDKTSPLPGGQTVGEALQQSDQYATDYKDKVDVATLISTFINALDYATLTGAEQRIVIACITSRFQGMRTLTLNGCHVLTMDDFNALRTEFRFLEHLTLRASCMGDGTLLKDALLHLLAETRLHQQLTISLDEYACQQLTVKGFADVLTNSKAIKLCDSNHQHILTVTHTTPLANLRDMLTGCSPIIKACLTYWIAKQEEKLVDIRSQEVIEWVVRNDVASIQKALYSGGLDVMMRADRRGNTLLHLAARDGHEAMVNFLVQYYDTVDKCNENWNTPLHIATYKKHREIVATLISKGADTNAKGNNRYTPMHLAALTNNQDMVDTLLSHRADVNQSDDRGLKPSEVAEKEGHTDLAGRLASIKPSHEETIKALRAALEEAQIRNQEVTYALEQTQQTLEIKNVECQRLQQQLGAMEEIKGLECLKAQMKQLEKEIAQLRARREAMKSPEQRDKEIERGVDDSSIIQPSAPPLPPLPTKEEVSATAQTKQRPARIGLLDEIQQGKKLRRVQSEPNLPRQVSNPMEEALKNAMDNRRQAMYEDSDDEMNEGMDYSW